MEGAEKTPGSLHLCQCAGGRPRSIGIDFSKRTKFRFRLFNARQISIHQFQGRDLFSSDQGLCLYQGESEQFLMCHGFCSPPLFHGYDGSWKNTIVLRFLHLFP